jgi:hypothetical protein
MMTHVEVGAALARKAYQLVQRGDSEAAKIKIISRLFAGEVGRILSRSILKIVMGCGQFDQKAIADILANCGHSDLAASFANFIPDMDRLADIVFER